MFCENLLLYAAFYKLLSFLSKIIKSLILFLNNRFYLPVHASRTKGGIRGFKPWFDERQVQIAVTRVIRDDPAKKVYEYVILLTISPKFSSSFLGFRSDVFSPSFVRFME